MPETPTKAMSVVSPGTPSEGPTVPNPTPLTEPLGREVVEPPPPMDFALVAKILAPVQETLNESADEAMLPSPPINTPEAFSPAPSVYKCTGRGRGLSLIGDRLTLLKLQERKYSTRDSDNCSSNRSVADSIEEGGEDNKEMDDKNDDGVGSDNGKGEVQDSNNGTLNSPSTSSPPLGSIPIGLGSPKVNPWIAACLSFSSKDLPAKAATSSLNVDAPFSAEPNTGVKNGAKPKNSIDSETGVTEKSNWGDELEERVNMSLLQLEQLAADEAVKDPSATEAEYYMLRLKRLLGDGERKFRLKVEIQDDSGPQEAPGGVKTKVDAEDPNKVVDIEIKTESSKQE